MSTYRKKPIIVQATQWHRNGDHEVVRVYSSDASLKRECQYCGCVLRDHGWIDTLEGGHIVCPQDWIITGIHGEAYPCKPSIFEATYEIVTR